MMQWLQDQVQKFGVLPFVVSIIGSVLAAYLKDWIPIILSNASARMKRTERKRLKRTARHLRAIREHPILLATVGIGVLRRLFLAFVLLIAFATFPMVNDYYLRNPSLDVMAGWMPPIRIGSITLRVVLIAFWVIAVWQVYQIPSSHFLYHRGVKQLTRKFRLSEPA